MALSILTNKMSEVVTLAVDQIVVASNRRTLRELAVLADSIATLGLLNPITVTAEHRLIAGYHRLQACRLLGWSSIPAYVVTLSDIDAELAEIDENFVRNDLTILERAEHLHRRKALYEAKYPDAKAGVRRATGMNEALGYNVGEIISPTFTDDTASKVKLSPRTIRQDVQIAGSIAEDVKDALRDTEVADSKSDLLMLARMAEEEQRKVTEKLTAGLARSVQDATQLVKEDARAEELKDRLDVPKSRPYLYVASAEALPLGNETVDVIITSPPYNLGSAEWPMGGDGRTPREEGIGYQDALPEDAYQAWQVRVFCELYRVAKPGASFFYNHKARQREGAVIHPLDWIRHPDNPWTLRQEIVWDRGSTHNHSPALFWPEDERIYWLTKGRPTIPEGGIGQPSVWRVFGPVPNTWHPAPFTAELPKRCLQAVGRPGITVLDPFGGSMTTCKVALGMGYTAIGVDIDMGYVEQARLANEWT